MKRLIFRLEAEAGIQSRDLPDGLLRLWLREDLKGTRRAEHLSLFHVTKATSSAQQGEACQPGSPTQA